jgi:uncharacterized protein (TIGR00661 family)
MKILYGVQATGNGHISRSREVIRELKDQGHDVKVILSGRESSLLWEMDEFKPYETFHGLTFSYHRGKLKYMHTALQLNLVRFYRDIHSFDAVDYHLVITDFEPLSARIARRNKLPLIGIGHQYAFTHDIPVEGGNPLARFILNNYAPADFPVGLHWHHFKQPILPPIIPHHMEPDHKIQKNKIIVYLPFERTDDIFVLLEEFQNYEFYIYHRFKQADDQNNIHMRPYSRIGFLEDLAECNGVICNAGFELVSEALHLGKKILVKPLAGQMEQLSNAMVISQLKLGMSMKRLDKTKVFKFLGIPGGSAVKYPNVARFIADWIDSGHWEDVEGLAQMAWKQTDISLG